MSYINIYGDEETQDDFARPLKTKEQEENKVVDCWCDVNGSTLASKRNCLDWNHDEDKCNRIFQPNQEKPDSQQKQEAMDWKKWVEEIIQLDDDSLKKRIAELREKIFKSSNPIPEQ